MSEKQFSGKVSQMKLDNKFLASEDFLGLGEIELVISGIYQHTDEVMQDGKKKNFFSVGFNDKPKRMILNVTNRKALAMAFGADVKKWIGQKVIIYVQDNVRNPAGGAAVHGLRIKTNAVRAARINPLQAKEESGL
jgi:hypothetical protein